MEHILQFGINIDDEAIKKSVAKNAEKSITESIQNKVEKEIFRRKGWGADDVEFTRWAEQIVIGYLTRHKEEIIHEAAKMLSDRLLRTKAVKEAVNGVLEKEK